MDIIEQVCELQQAIELKELGLDQTSLFFWNKAKSGPHGELPNYGYSSNAIASAYTVAELGRFMPESFEHDGQTYIVSCDRLNGKYFCSIRIFDQRAYDTMQLINFTEAGARAALIINANREGITAFNPKYLNANYRA